MTLRKLLCACLLAGSAVGPAVAATISVSGTPFAERGTRWNLSGFADCAQHGPVATNVGTFSGSVPRSRPFLPGSQCGDAASVQVRNGPDGHGREHLGIHSNDLRVVEWVLPENTREVVFRAQDIADVRFGTEWQTEKFELRAGGAIATIHSQPNGTANWFRIVFAPGDERRITGEMFPTADRTDGWRIDSVSTAPIPLPATPLLLVSALGLGVAIARRRTRA
jgi:hypothetical protein